MAEIHFYKILVCDFCPKWAFDSCNNLKFWVLSNLSNWVLSQFQLFSFDIILVWFLWTFELTFELTWDFRFCHSLSSWVFVLFMIGHNTICFSFVTIGGFFFGHSLCFFSVLSQFDFCKYGTFWVRESAPVLTSENICKSVLVLFVPP